MVLSILLLLLQVLALLQQLNALPAKSQMRDACTALLAQPVAADVAVQLSAALQQLDLAGGIGQVGFWCFGCVMCLFCHELAVRCFGTVAQLSNSLAAAGPGRWDRISGFLVF
jgi:hypothetical protein